MIRAKLKGRADLDKNDKQISGAHNENAHKSKKKLLWTFVFIAIAGLTVWAITAQNKNFSFKEFSAFIMKANPFWVAMAFLGMLGFIVFEGMALLCICKAFGYRRGVSKGYIYSASDIYFSAITPSASGGQPASAYFMVKDGIPGSLVTVALLINLVMYTFAILTLGIIAFLVRPTAFLQFAPLSKILIIAGVLTLSVLAAVFILVLKKHTLLHSVCDRFLSLLAKLKIVRRLEKKRKKLANWVESYRECAAAIGGKTSMLVKAFIFNFLQRLSLTLVTVFSFLAGGGAPSETVDVLMRQIMVVLGSNCVPIPGAMGVADYLMLDAFSQIIDDASAVVNLELLSRTVSFYFCVLLCGASLIVRIISDKIKAKRNKDLLNVEI